MQIVKLRPRRLNELETLRTHRAQWRPSETQGIIGLTENGSCCGLCSGEIRLERFAFFRLQPRSAHQIEHGWQNVCRPNLRIDDLRLASLTSRRQFNNQRDMGGGIVQKYSVRIFMVLTQAFPVVAHDHDHGVRIPAMLLEVSNEVS